MFLDYKGCASPLYDKFVITLYIIKQLYNGFTFDYIQ